MVVKAFVLNVEVVTVFAPAVADIEVEIARLQLKSLYSMTLEAASDKVKLTAGVVLKLGDAGLIVV
jgi:hypothetical protein